METWEDVVAALNADETVRMINQMDHGAFVAIDDTPLGRPLLVLVALVDPGYQSGEYVYLETRLGSEDEVDALVAAKCGSGLVGGAHSTEGNVLLRVVRSFETLNEQRLGLALSQLMGATTAYFLSI